MTHRPDKLSDIVGGKESRKINRRGEQEPSLWAHLGLFGVVGWAVSIPTVLGALLGWWLDTHWPQRFSWTLMLMLIGLIAGCGIAWKWLQGEHGKDGDDGDDGDDGPPRT